MVAKGNYQLNLIVVIIFSKVLALVYQVFYDRTFNYALTKRKVMFSIGNHRAHVLGLSYLLSLPFFD